MENRIDRLDRVIESALQSLSHERSGNADFVERVLWNSSFKTMTRLRVFYDYMRSQYDQKLEALGLNDEDLNYNFSCACSNQCPSNSTPPRELVSLMEREPELKNLCLANQKVLQFYEANINLFGPDYTQIDYSKTVRPTSVSGGDTRLDGRFAFGSWQEISTFPVKFTSMLMLSSSQAYYYLGGGLGVLPWYSGQSGQGRYTYAKLYPFEYRNLFNRAVINNLKTAEQMDEDPVVGRSFVHLPYLSREFNKSNDRMPPGQSDSFKSLLGAQFESGALILNADWDPESQKIKKISGIFYNPTLKKDRHLEEVYILPGNRVLAKLKGDFFAYATSTIIPGPIDTGRSPKTAEIYAWAIVAKYDSNSINPLKAAGPMDKLVTEYNTQMRQCINGIQMDEYSSGLSRYFKDSSSNFDGFSYHRDTADSKKGAEHREALRASIVESFAAFEKEILETPFCQKAGNRSICESAVTQCDRTFKNVEMLMGAIALWNGLWLPQLGEYLVWE